MAEAWKGASPRRRPSGRSWQGNSLRRSIRAAQHGIRRSGAAVRVLRRVPAAHVSMTLDYIIVAVLFRRARATRLRVRVHRLNSASCVPTRAHVEPSPGENRVRRRRVGTPPRGMVEAQAVPLLDAFAGHPVRGWAFVIVERPIGLMLGLRRPVSVTIEFASLAVDQSYVGREVARRGPRAPAPPAERARRRARFLTRRG